jgi:endonuclease/exonuclease/phosphatase family metal-dependent hydrolase
LLEAADADRHVAVLSKVPFKEVRRHAGLAITYFGQKDVVKRGALELIFATNEGDLSVFVIHLKSKFTERKEDPEGAIRRQMEAEAVRDLVLSRYPDPAKARFVVCGDWNDTRSSKVVRALQKRGDTELGEILPAADSRGEAWTYFYRREDAYSCIDYLLVSPALQAFVTAGRATVWDGPGVGEASDHRPVFLQFKLETLK